MKKYYLTLAIFVLALSTQAQNFDLSLSYLNTDESGYYEIALLGTPNFDETNGNSSDMGAVVSISGGGFLFPESSGFENDCVYDPVADANECEYDISSSEWSRTKLDGPSMASGNQVYQLLRMPGADNVHFDAVNSNPIILAVFRVGGAPTTGDAILIENGDPLLAGSFSSSFFNINYPVATAGSTADIVGVIDTTPVNFATLSTQRQELIGASLYPNPTSGNVSIKGVNDLQSVEVMNVNGQRIMAINGGFETINVSSLNSGVYFVKLQTAIATKTIKLIKE